MMDALYTQDPQISWAQYRPHFLFHFFLYWSWDNHVTQIKESTVLQSLAKE